MNLIWQYYLGAPPKWLGFATKSIKDYAAKNNCEYQFTSKQYIDNMPPHYNVLRLFFDKEFDKYDKVAFIDADIYDYETEGNIFDEPFTNIGFVMGERNTKMMNSGVLLTTKEFRLFGREKFTDYEEYFKLKSDKWYLDQEYLFDKIREEKIDYTLIDKKWNYMSRIRHFPKEPGRFYHYNIGNKEIILKHKK